MNSNPITNVRPPPTDSVNIAFTCDHYVKWKNKPKKDPQSVRHEISQIESTLQSGDFKKTNQIISAILAHPKEYQGKAIKKVEELSKASQKYQTELDKVKNLIEGEDFQNAYVALIQLRN